MKLLKKSFVNVLEKFEDKTRDFERFKEFNDKIGETFGQIEELFNGMEKVAADT